MTDSENITGRGAPVAVFCPYCQTQNTFRPKTGTLQSLANLSSASVTELVSCDVEEGGCDRFFVFSVLLRTSADARAYPLPTLYPEAAPEPEPEDRRLWEVKIRHADEPEGDSTEYLNAEQVRKRAELQPLYAYALTFTDGDHLKAVSPDNLSEVEIKCSEPEEAERFASFVLARRKARRLATQTGAPWEIYFDGESFRLYATNPLPVPSPPVDFELVATVEVPVLFKIRTQRVGVHSTVDAPEGYFFAEVFCDDERANPDLQSHGNSEVFRSEPRPTPGEAASAAADFIRSEFSALDFEIESDTEIPDEDIPL